MYIFHYMYTHMFDKKYIISMFKEANISNN